MSYKDEHRRVGLSLMEDEWTCERCGSCYFVTFEPDHNTWRLNSTLMIRCRDCRATYRVLPDYREHRRGPMTNRNVWLRNCYRCT